MNWLTPLDIGLAMGLVFAWPVLALALGLRLLSFPDLTVEGSFPLGAAVFAALLRAGAPMSLAAVAAVAAGMTAGALTGFLHARFKVNKFLAGIIVVAISYSLSLRIMDGPNVGLLRFRSIFDVVEPIDRLGGRYLHPGTLGLLLVMTAIGVILLGAGLSSRQGVRLRTVGSNAEFARSLGMNTSGYLVTGLAATNGLAALGGCMLSTVQGFADVSMGQGVLVLALASMAIGERLLRATRWPAPVFVIAAAVLGSVAYQLAVAYALRLGLPASDLKLVTALLVLVVVVRVVRDPRALGEAFG